MTSQSLRLAVRPEPDVERLVAGMFDYHQQVRPNPRSSRASVSSLNAHRSRRPVSHRSAAAP